MTVKTKKQPHHQQEFGRKDPPAAPRLHHAPPPASLTPGARRVNNNDDDDDDSGTTGSDAPAMTVKAEPTSPCQRDGRATASGSAGIPRPLVVVVAPTTVPNDDDNGGGGGGAGGRPANRAGVVPKTPPSSSSSRRPGTDGIGDDDDVFVGGREVRRPSSGHQQQLRCGGCGGRIAERFFLHAADRHWHCRCLKCCVCGVVLDGSFTCFSRHGRIYCRDDYFRTYVATCSGCGRSIAQFELVMRARHLVFHLHCFVCRLCRRLLTKGDQFGISEDDAVLCRAHLLTPSTSAGGDVKRQRPPQPGDEFGDGSSGAGDDKMLTSNDSGGDPGAQDGFDGIMTQQQGGTNSFHGRIPPNSSGAPNQQLFRHPPYHHHHGPDCENGMMAFAKTDPSMGNSTYQPSSSGNSPTLGILIPSSSEGPAITPSPHTLHPNDIPMMLHQSGGSLMMGPDYGLRPNDDLDSCGPVLLGHQQMMSAGLVAPDCNDMQHHLLLPFQSIGDPSGSLSQFQQHPHPPQLKGKGKKRTKQQQRQEMLEMQKNLEMNSALQVDGLVYTVPQGPHDLMMGGSSVSGCCGHEGQQGQCCPNNCSGLGGSQRTKRMRTSFKHHQLRTMKSYFALNQNPDAKDLKQLAQKTNLSKRVLQVWFQNARAKWRRSMQRQGLNPNQTPGDGVMPGTSNNPSGGSSSLPETSIDLGPISNPNSDYSNNSLGESLCSVSAASGDGAGLPTIQGGGQDLHNDGSAGEQTGPITFRPLPSMMPLSPGCGPSSMGLMGPGDVEGIGLDLHNLSEMYVG